MTRTKYASFEAMLTALGGTATRSTTTTYRTSAGTLVEAAINTLPIEYGDDGVFRGLQIFPASTNLITNSEIAVAGNQVAIGANTTAAPDGTTTADSFTETAVNSDHYIDWNTAEAIADNATVSGSAWVKANGRTLVRVFLIKKNGSAGEATVNLTTGEIAMTSQGTGGGTATARIEKYFSGWWRIMIDGVDVLTGGVTPRVRIGLLSGTYASPVVSYLGDGTSGAFSWGGQLEALPAVTPYIKTVGAIVTRTAPTIHVPHGLHYASGQNATLFVDFTPIITTTGGPLSLNDGTTSNRMSMVGTGGNANSLVSVGGVVDANFAAGALTKATRAKVATRYALNDFHGALGGVLSPSPDTLGAIPSTARLQLGATPASTLYGWVRAFGLANRAFTNAELQEVTT